MSAAYERDFFAWASEQAALLRSGRLKEADIARIAEEIESMGEAEKLLAGDGQGSASRPGGVFCATIRASSRVSKRR